MILKKNKFLRALLLLPLIGVLSGCVNNQEDPVYPTSVDLPVFEEERHQLLTNLTDSTEECSYYLNKPVNFDYAGYGPTSYGDEFLSHQKKTYNVNGKNVDSYLLYVPNMHNTNHPNVSMGILLYKAILHKLANPTVENEVTITSFHFSIIAGVNLLPSSPYYGSLKSMPDEVMDKDGFVRFSYLVYFAAKIGIKITVIPQIVGYSDYGEEIEPADYFVPHLEDSCSVKMGLSDYKIKDFMSFKLFEWVSYGDKSAADMMHLKSLTVKHYLNQEGQTVDYGIFSSSSNLDGVNRNGVSGHTEGQTGILITNHEYLYLALRNYSYLMGEYCGKFDPAKFRMEFLKKCNEQKEIIKTEGYQNIKDEMVLYSGTENDSVFRMYFSPYSDEPNTWSDDNPFCYYVDKLRASNGPIKTFWTNPKFETNNAFFNNFVKRLANAYTVARPSVNANQSVLCVQSGALKVDMFKDIIVGKHVIKKDLQVRSGSHQKDFIFEYEEDGEQVTSVLFSTANNHFGAYFYQINSLIIVNESANQLESIAHKMMLLYGEYEFPLY